MLVKEELTPEEQLRVKEEWDKLAVIIHEAKRNTKTEPHFKPLDLKPEDDLKPGEFVGLTNAEYYFILDDIDQAVAEANEKYGYGGSSGTITVAKGNRISKFIRLKQYRQYQLRQRRTT